MTKKTHGRLVEKEEEKKKERKKMTHIYTLLENFLFGRGHWHKNFRGSKKLSYFGKCAGFLFVCLFACLFVFVHLKFLSFPWFHVPCFTYRPLPPPVPSLTVKLGLLATRVVTMEKKTSDLGAIQVLFSPPSFFLFFSFLLLFFFFLFGKMFKFFQGKPAAAQETDPPVSEPVSFSVLKTKEDPDHLFPFFLYG